MRQLYQHCLTVVKILVHLQLLRLYVGVGLVLVDISVSKAAKEPSTQCWRLCGTPVQALATSLLVVVPRLCAVSKYMEWFYLVCSTRGVYGKARTPPQIPGFE